MTDDLTKRLRARGNRYDNGAMFEGELINPDGPEAANELEAAYHDIERLQSIVNGYANNDEYKALLDELDTLRAKLAEAEAQLPRGIRDGRFSADKRTALGEQL